MNVACFFNDKGRLIGADFLSQAQSCLEERRDAMVAVYGRMLKDENSERRISALRRLAKIGNRSALTLLAQNLRQKQKELRKTATRNKRQEQFFLQAA